MRTANLLVIIGLLVLAFLPLRCGTRLYIPEYDTAQEQYFYALKIKNNPYKSLAPDSRDAAQKEAIEALELLIKRFPDDPSFTPLAYVSMADSYYNLHRYKKALKVYSLAQEKYPNQDDIEAASLFGQARAYEKLKKFSQANELYKNCIDKFSDDQREEVQNIVKKCQYYYQKLKRK